MLIYCNTCQFTVIIGDNEGAKSMLEILRLIFEKQLPPSSNWIKVNEGIVRPGIHIRYGI